MWNTGLYPEKQTELADLPQHCNLTVKDLLLSGSGGDLVSSPYPNSRASELEGPPGFMEPQHPHFISETGKLSHKGWIVQGHTRASLWAPVLSSLSSLSPELGHLLLQS